MNLYHFSEQEKFNSERPCSVAGNVLDCDIIVSKFKLQSYNYIPRLILLENVWAPLFPFSYGLNSIHIYPPRSGRIWHKVNFFLSGV